MGVNMGVRDHRARSQCWGKKPYPTKAKADRTRRALHQRDDHRMDVYKCGVCNAWHVGHEWGRVPRRTPSHKRDRVRYHPLQVYLDRESGYEQRGTDQHGFD